ncbi:hypothetical protein [Candidatus Clostridium helianthi]|jgi:hypothetical protein|uniref:CDI immunity protein domain-containing protein n=1 Tax=Candidatus Clostridium helianthi TaxID=3381660 RepID=A0ABW8S176_9CLOT
MGKKITEEIYLDKAQNGARKLFDINNYRFLDGNKEDYESYFLIDFDDNIFYELSLKEAYNLLALYVCNDVSEHILVNQIEELIQTIE